MTMTLTQLEQRLAELKVSGVAPDAKVWVFSNFMHFELLDAVKLVNQHTKQTDVSLVAGEFPMDMPMGGVSDLPRDHPGSEPVGGA